MRAPAVLALCFAAACVRGSSIDETDDNVDFRAALERLLPRDCSLAGWQAALEQEGFQCADTLIDDQHSLTRSPLLACHRRPRLDASRTWQWSAYLDHQGGRVRGISAFVDP